MTLTRRQTRENYQELEAKSLSESLPEGINLGSTRNKLIYDKTLKYYPIYLNIINGAIWGVLTRKGLMLLTTYDGSYLSGVVWANFAACLVMGILVDSNRIWTALVEEPSNKGTIPLYIGITTGFCGTCSSYLSLILEAFTESSNVHHSGYPNAAYGIMQFLSVVIAQLGVSIFGFSMGKNIIELLDSRLPKLTKKAYQRIEFASMSIGVATYITSIVLAGVLKSWRSWMFSIIFAPPGALIRFYMSKYFNARIRNFPLGTFIINVGGTLVLSCLYIVGRGRRGDGRILTSIIGCQIVTGLDDGFCGALTTISTFVVELCALKTYSSYRYGLVSIAVSFSLVVITLGAYQWSVGLVDPLCT